MAEDLTREAQKIWNALRVMVDAEIDKRTASCVRSRKMTVMSAPNGSTIGVAEPFGQTVNIPYSSALANVKVGDTVWVDWKFDNASTMVAMATGEGQIVPDYFDVNNGNRNLLEARKFIQTNLTDNGDLVSSTADTVPMDYTGVGASNYYIHVSPSTKYRLTLYDTRIETDTVSCKIAEYNTNGTFVRLAASGINWRQPEGLTFVTSVNTAFLRLSLVGFPKYRWKLEEGENSTEWQPSPEDVSPYTFDSTPTNNSKNPVTSDGVYDALALKVSKSGDTMTGTLNSTHFRVYDASYPMVAFISSASDASALGAMFEDLALRRMAIRQKSSAGYSEDYFLPSNEATSANAQYTILTSKGGVSNGDITAPNFIVKSGSGPQIMGRNASDQSLGTIDFLTTGQMRIRCYKVGVGSENYVLPVPTTGVGTEYQILTTKDGVFAFKDQNISVNMSAGQWSTFSVTQFATPTGYYRIALDVVGGSNTNCRSYAFVMANANANWLTVYASQAISGTIQVRATYMLATAAKEQ